MKPVAAEAKRIFLEAVESYPPQEWDAFTAQECAGDPALLQRVCELLSAHAAHSESPTDSGDMDTLAVGEREGDQIGPYLLVQRIGEGGFSVVYRAHQTQPLCRAVALKLLKPGLDTRRVIARFEAERQVLALMQHPNIARVLDAGATESGHPFFVMELIDGIAITDFCQRERLTLPDRLRLFVHVCRAVQHAHLKGIIHRDLKPSNLLVTSEDRAPVVKVIDFGIAKAIGPTNEPTLTLTGHSQIVGTPMYMSPEQASCGAVDVDVRSDVYALGVVLFELLTGLTPFDKKLANQLGWDELRHLIRNEDPPKPSSRLRMLTGTQREEFTRERQSDPQSIVRQIKPELDWIVMKALNRQRTLRYQSTEALANDIERFLNQQPVEACPPSRLYATQKFVARNRIALAVVGLFALVLIAATGVSLWQVRETRQANLLNLQFLERERHAKQEVTAREGQLRRVLYGLEMKTAWLSWQAGDSAAARGTLDRQLPSAGLEDLRDFAWYYLERNLRAEILELKGHASPVLAAAVSPDSRLIAGSDRAGHVLIWDGETGDKLQELHYAEREVTSLAFSPDSLTLATAGQDSRIHLWETASWQELRSFGEHDGTITSIAWSPDGKAIASAGRDRAVRIWDPPTGVCQQQLADLTEVVRSVAWSPDGSRLAAADGPTVRLWETQSWQLLNQWHDQEEVLHCVAFSPDGRQLAAVGYDMKIRVFDVHALVASSTLKAGAHLWSVAFSPDDRLLLAGSNIDGPRIWRRSGPDFVRVPGTVQEGGRLRSLEFADQGRKLVTAFETSMRVDVWDLGRALGYRRQLFEQPLLAMNYQQDLLATLAGHGSIQIRKMHSGSVLGSLPLRPNPIRAATFSDSADMLAVASGTELSIWDVERAVFLRRMPDAPWPIWRLLYSRSGELLACGNFGGDSRLLEVSSGRVIGDFPSRAQSGPHFALTPDGGLLATVDQANAIRLWSTRTGELQLELPTPLFQDLQFSSDGRLLAACGEHGVKLWSIEDRELVANLAHPVSVRGLALSPDDRTLASLDIDNTVRLYDLATHQEMFILVQHEHPLDWVQFASSTTLLVGAHFADSPHPGILIFEAAP